MHSKLWDIVRQPLDTSVYPAFPAGIPKAADRMRAISSPSCLLLRIGDRERGTLSPGERVRENFTHGSEGGEGRVASLSLSARSVGGDAVGSVRVRPRAHSAP
jgi:hypothetical protein